MNLEIREGGVRLVADREEISTLIESLREAQFVGKAEGSLLDQEGVRNVEIICPNGGTAE